MNPRIIYIETNEEITSIIHRAKDVKNTDIILVIPKKAAVIRSVVNLKILKKQLSKLGKEAVIVTADKLGKGLASKAGFIVKQKLDNDAFDYREESNEEANEAESKEEDRSEGVQSIPVKNFVPSTPSRIERQSNIAFRGMDIIRKAPPASGNEIDKRPIFKDKIKSNLPSLSHLSSFANLIKEDSSSGETTGSEKDKANLESGVTEGRKVIILPSFGKKLFFGLSMVTILVIAVVLFLVLPTATISVEQNTQLIAKETDLVVDQSAEQVNPLESKIPGKVIEVSKEITKEFEATGKKKITQKASGTITVYNEWDSQSQPLVESTRFVSEDDKIFRSAKTVVVPGFKRLEGKDIPGSVTVSVVADEAGEGGNIKASRFTIPGLKGTVKYEKIYGVSAEAMSGGRTGELRVVSEDDFSKAKKSIEASLKEEIANEIKSQSNSEAMVMEDSIVIEKTDLTSSKKVGEEAEKFSITFKLKGSALAFNEQNTASLVSELVNQQIPMDKYSLAGEPKLSYIKADFLPKQNKMNLKVYFEATVAGKIKKDDILNNVKSKNITELKDYFANVEEVKNVDVKFWPFWVNQVPRIEDKINIDIK